MQSAMGCYGALYVDVGRWKWMCGALWGAIGWYAERYGALWGVVC